MPRPPSNKERGDALERRVASYYEALGYQVTRDVRIHGHQVDIIARRYVPGASTVTLAVEVKYRNSILGINDATPFINTSVHLITNMAVNGAVLVTNAKVSAEAKSAVFNLDSIRLLNIGDLEQDLFNNSESLLRIIHDLENSPQFSYYYPLKAKHSFTTIDDSAEHLLKWAQGNESIVVLLGDFGSGKSTILDHVFHDCAKERLENPEAMFPIMLRLGSLRKFADLWQFIEASLRDNQYLTPPRSAFEAELRAGRLLVLLDGFDEIHTGADAQDRAEFLHTLGPLMRSKSPCILSSRPTFFDSIDEVISSIVKLLVRPDQLDRLPPFGINRLKLAHAFGGAIGSVELDDFGNVLTLCQLDDQQVTAAIQRRADLIRDVTGMSVTQFKTYLYDIYDLKDLMTRPLLLDMILSTVATGAIDIQSKRTVGPSTLYDLYTQRSALRDGERLATDQFLGRDERLKACRAIACQMLAKREIVLTAAEVAACIIQGGFQESMSATDIDRAVTDIRACSFLRFSDDGSLQFTHTSYFEFFIAQEIFISASISRYEFLKYSAQLLTKEVYYFLASYARDHDTFASSLRAWAGETREPVERSFLFKIVFSSGKLLSETPLSDGRIDHVELRKAAVENASLNNVLLSNCTIKDLGAGRWVASNVFMDHVLIRDALFVDSKLEISAHELDLTNCVLKKSTIALNGDQIKLDTCRIEESDIIIDGYVTVMGLDVNFGSITLGCQGNLQMMRKSRFNECIFRSERNSVSCSNLTDIEIKDSFLMGLWFDSHHKIFDAEKRSENSVVISGCYGIIIVPLFAGITRTRNFWDFKRRNRRLVLVNSNLFMEDEPLEGKLEDKHAMFERARRRLGPGIEQTNKGKIRKVAAALRRAVTKLHVDEATLPSALQHLLRQS